MIVSCSFNHTVSAGSFYNKPIDLPHLINWRIQCYSSVVPAYDSRLMLPMKSPTGTTFVIYTVFQTAGVIYGWSEGNEPLPRTAYLSLWANGSSNTSFTVTIVGELADNEH